jgi:hypothetical protein
MNARNKAIYDRRARGETFRAIAVDYHLTAPRVHQICVKMECRLLNVDRLSVRALAFMECAKKEGYASYADVPRHMVARTKTIGLLTYNELEAVYKGAKPITLKEFYEMVKG